MIFDFGLVLLFCFVDCLEWFGKVFDCVDVVIVDFEDVVFLEVKVVVWEYFVVVDFDFVCVIVWVNVLVGEDFGVDFEVVVRIVFCMVMVVKMESVDVFLMFLEDYFVIVLCEMVCGIYVVVEIVVYFWIVGMMWGVEDLVVLFGGMLLWCLDGGYWDIVCYV